MRRQGRRAVLMAAAMATVAALAGPAVAQPAGIRGEIVYEGGAVIPEGKIEIRLEGASVAGQDAATTRVHSDGKSRAIDFVLTTADSAPPAPEVVARLERADGWLVARGSAQVEGADASVQVTLNTAMY